MEPCRLLATDLACRRGDRLLFRGLSLALTPGDALQVTGPNGTGKSSLLRMMAGLLRPVSGTVERTGSVALLDERPALDEHLPLARALQFWRAIDRHSAPPAELGLEHLLDVPVRYLSTGQRKRAALARLLGQQAPVWLLDEPFNGLDADTVATCQNLVANHCDSGGIAVIASHQPFMLPQMAKLPIESFAP